VTRFGKFGAEGAASRPAPITPILSGVLLIAGWAGAVCAKALNVAAANMASTAVPAITRRSAR